MKKYANTIFWVLIFSDIVLAAVVYWITNCASIAASASIAFGVVIAALQFLFNLEQASENALWNKRQLAMTETRKIAAQLEPIIEELKEKFDYAERKVPYKISEIHAKFGNFTDEGKEFQFNHDGKKFKSDIIKLLNLFEYIATGVNLGIFDDNVVRKLMRGKMIYAYSMFESYIHHLRSEHGWENVYIELELLVKKWQNAN